MKNGKIVLTIGFLFLISFVSGLKAKTEKAEVFKFSDSESWVIQYKKTEILNYQGKKALRINPAKGAGVVYLKEFQFTDGIIELDIAAIPRFTGLIFRVQDKDTYEGIYFRPQNSRHTNPDKRDKTVQYISHPKFTWPVLRKNFPGRYEAAVDLEPDKWFHVKVVVRGVRAEVFVNNSSKACLVIENLKKGLSKGSVGVWTGNTSAGTFANLKVTRFAKAATNYSAQQNYLFSVFKNRRSVRKFKSTPVAQEHLHRILDMARCAPTSGNQQPWKFFVIQDRDKLDLLKNECVNRSITRAKLRGLTGEQLKSSEKRATTYFTDYLSAPVYVVVLTDSNSKYPSYNVKDGPLAAGYLMIAARSLGYGTVFATDSIPYDLIKKTFNIPENYQFVCFTPIGVPVEWPTGKSKKRLEELVVFDKFIKDVNYTLPIKRVVITLDQQVLKTYVGSYQLSPQTTIKITLDSGQLYGQAGAQQKFKLYPEAKNKFFLKVTDAQITFEQDGNGTVTGLILHQGGQNLKAKKIEE